MISVALCTFNGEKFISSQLDSILRQSLPVDEIIVCDDCSTDSTISILQKYATQFSVIHLIENEHNLGYVANFEKAIQLCQGDYIFLSDQDDIWHLDKVAISVHSLSTSGMYGAFTNARIIDRDGSLVDRRTLFERLNLLPYIQQGILQQNLFGLLCLRGNFVTGATLVLTRRGREIVLPFRTTSSCIHDGWIALRLSGVEKLGFIERPLIDYRLHPEQQVGLSFISSKDFIAECFNGYGSIYQLMRRRRRFGAMSNIFGFGRKEQHLSFQTYFELWKRNCSKGPRIIIEWLLFLLSEVFVWLKFNNSKHYSRKATVKAM